jgi:hypothetical protein
MLDTPSPRAARRRFYPLSLGFILCAVLFALPASSYATTVVAPDFDSLVKQADLIVRGTVKAVDSEWRERNNERFIVSKVTIQVNEMIAGIAPQPLVLQMLGGKIGDESFFIEGAPSFNVGEEHILFVRDNGKAFYPLVGIMHGQYPIKAGGKAGERFVMRSNGVPLHNESEVSLPMVAAPSGPFAAALKTNSTQPALTPTEFIQRIRASRGRSQAKK